MEVPDKCPKCGNDFARRGFDRCAVYACEGTAIISKITGKLLTSASRQCLVNQINALKAERDELRADINNAVKCAKNYCPHYPHDQFEEFGASAAVWACGEGLRGVSEACEEWRKKCNELQAIVDKLPRTADGVPISLGDYGYALSDSGHVYWVHCSSMEHGFPARAFYRESVNCFSNSFVYSTREAAEAAAEQLNQGVGDDTSR